MPSAEPVKPMLPTPTCGRIVRSGTLKPYPTSTPYWSAWYETPSELPPR